MKRIIYLASTLLVFAAALQLCAAETAKQTTETSVKKRIALLNLNEAVTKATMKRLKTYAERQLRIKTDIIEKDVDKDIKKLSKYAENIDQSDDFKENYPVIVAVCSSESSEEHVYTSDSKRITVINIIPLQTSKDERFVQRLERLMMRGAGKAAGLGFDPDPHCVMHSYKTIEDLDKMGRNFSPPWQAMFNSAAKRMGLEIIPYSPKKP